MLLIRNLCSSGRSAFSANSKMIFTANSFCSSPLIGEPSTASIAMRRTCITVDGDRAIPAVAISSDTAGTSSPISDSTVTGATSTEASDSVGDADRESS